VAIVTSEEGDIYSVNDLTRDLDELAGRFRRRFQLDGDTGKGGEIEIANREFLSSLSEAGNLIADLDEVARRHSASLRSLATEGDTGKDAIGARTEVNRLVDEIDQLASDYRRKFPFTEGDTGKEGVVVTGFFSDLDRLAGLHRDRLTRVDGGGGDTGKDGEFRVAKANVGDLIDDLDTLADRYRRRLAGRDGGGGDTGKDR
jgi:hypothetical protein